MNDKKYSLYSKFREVHFALPRGWNDSSLGIFISACRLYIEDLQVADEESKWRRIVEYGSQREGNDKLFNVNCVIDLAPAIRSFIELHRERMSNIPAFSEFYKDVEPILGFFPLDHRINRRRSFSSDKPDSKSDLSLEDAVFDVLDEHMESIRSKKANCWMEISREVSDRLGIACNVKQFLKGKKERVVVEAQGEDSHEKRKEVFLLTVGRLLNAFDFIEPYAVKKDDFLRAEELPDSEDKPPAKKGRPKKKSFLEEGPSTDLSECVFETFPVSPDEPDNTVEVVVDFATETEKDPDPALGAVPDEVLKSCAQQLGDKLPDSNQAESKPEPTPTSQMPTEPSQSSKDHADATTGSSVKKIPSVPLGSASKRKRGRPPSKIQVTESDDLPMPWGMAEEIVTETLKKDSEGKVDKSLRTDSKKEKDKKSNKAELDVKPRMPPSKESFESKSNSSGETVHLKPEDTKSLLKTKNAKNEQKTTKRNRSVSKENLTDDSDKLEVKGENKSTRLHDSKKEKKKLGSSPSKAMDEEPEFLRVKGEMTRRQSPRLQSPKRPYEFIIPDDHFTGGNKYLPDPKDIPPGKSPPCTRILRSEVQYHHNLNLKMTDDRLPMKKRSCRTLRSQDRLETDQLELNISVKQSSSNESSPVSSPVVEKSDAFKLPMKKRGRCSIEISVASDPSITESSSSGSSPPVREDDDCHIVLRSQRCSGNQEAQPISPPKLRCKDERKLMKAVNDKLSMEKKPVAVLSDTKDQLETKTNLKDSPKKVGTISDIKSKQDKKKSIKKSVQEDQTNDLSEKTAERRSVSLSSLEGEKRRLRSGGLPEEVHQNEDVKFSSGQEKSFETPKDPEKKKKPITSSSKTKDAKPNEKSIVTKPIQKLSSEKNPKNKSSTKIKEVKNRTEEKKVDNDTESSNKKKNKKIKKPEPKIEEPEELPTRLAKTICQLVLAESHWRQPLSKPRSPRKPPKTDDDDKAHENHADSKSKKKVVSSSKSKDSEATKKKKENLTKICDKLKSSQNSHDTKGKIQVQEVQNDSKPAACEIEVSTEASNVSNDENESNTDSKTNIISNNECWPLVQDTSFVCDPEVQHEVVVPHNGNAVDCGSAFPPNFLQQNMDEAMLFNIVNQPDPASGIHVLAETALMSLPEVSGSVLKTDQQPSETENIVQMAQFLKEQMCGGMDGGFDSPIGSVPESPKALPLSKMETQPISSEEQMFLTKQFEKEEILLCSEEFQVIPSAETPLYVQTLPVTTIKCSDPTNQFAQKPCLVPTNTISYQNPIGKPVSHNLTVQTISHASELSRMFENEKITLYQSGPDVEIQDYCVEVCNSPIIEEIVTETPCIQEFVSQDFQKEIVERMAQDPSYSLMNSRTDSELLNIDCIAAEIEIGQTEGSRSCVIEESGKTYFTLGVVTKTDGTTAFTNPLNEFRVEKENSLEIAANYNIGLTSTNYVEPIKNFAPLETVTQEIYYQNNLENHKPLNISYPLSITQSMNELVVSTNSVNVEQIKETVIERPKIKSDIGKHSKATQVPDESKNVNDVSLPISTEKKIVKNVSKIPRITKIIRKLEIKLPELKEDVIPLRIPEALPELSKNFDELKDIKHSNSLESLPAETKVPSTVEKTISTVEKPTPNLEEPVPTVEEPVRTVEKTVPTVEQPVPTAEKSAPTAEKPVPTVEKPTPTAKEPVPTVEEPVLTVEKPVPTAEKSVPTAEKLVPTAEKLVPTAEKLVPTAEKSVPTAEKPVPTVEKPTPIVEEPVPTVEEPVPTVEEPVPTVEEPVPTVEKTVPTVEKPVPTAEKPVPTAGKPIPTVEQPVSIAGKPVPTVEQPVPIAGTPVPTVVEPIPTVEEPVPTVEKPARTAEKPVPTVENPVPTAGTPIPTVVEPVLIAGTPVRTAENPVPTAEKSVPTVEQPVPTVEQPVPVAEKPVPTAEKPVPTAEKTDPTVEKTVPTAEKPVPIVEQPVPTVEQPVPIVEQPVPTEEKPVPTVEKPVPTVEKVIPTVEKPVPTVEQPVPTVERTVPTVEKTVSTVENIVPTVESKEQVLPSPGVDISGTSTSSHEPRAGIVCSLPVSLFIPASVLPQPVVEVQLEAKEVLVSEQPVKESKEHDEVPKNSVDEVPKNSVDVSERLKDITPEPNVIEKQKEETDKLVNLEVKPTQEKGSNKSSTSADNKESLSILDDNGLTEEAISPASLQRKIEDIAGEELETTVIRLLMPENDIDRLCFLLRQEEDQRGGTIKSLPGLVDPTVEVADRPDEDVRVIPEDAVRAIPEGAVRINPEEVVGINSEEGAGVIPEEGVDTVIPEEKMDVIPEEVVDVISEEVVDVISEEVVDVISEEVVDVISEEVVDVISEEVVDVISEEVVDVISEEVVDVISEEVVDVIPEKAVPEEVVCVIPEEAVHVIPKEAVNAVPEKAARVIPEEAVPDIPEVAACVIPEKVQLIREEAAHAIPEEAAHIIPEKAVHVIPEEAVLAVPEEPIRVIPEVAVPDNPEEPVRVVPEEAVRVIPEQFDQESPRTGRMSSTRQSGDSVPHQARLSVLLQCDEISSTVQAELAQAEAASAESQRLPAAQPTVESQQQDPPRQDPPRQEAEVDPVPANPAPANPAPANPAPAPANPADAIPCGININIYPLIINKVRSKLPGGAGCGSRRTRRADKGDSGSRDRGSNGSEERKAEPTAEPISEAHLKKNFFENVLIQKFIDPDHRNPYVKVINCLKSRIFMNVPGDSIAVNRSDSCSVAKVDIRIEQPLDLNEKRDLRPDLNAPESKKCKESEISAEVVNKNDFPERTKREDDQIVLSPAKKGLTEDSAEKQSKLKKPTILIDPVKVCKGKEILLKKDDKQKVLVQIETEPASPKEPVNTDWDAIEDLENNTHGYLRSPPKKVYPSWKERVRERKEDDAVESLINALWESSKSEESEEEFLATDEKGIEGIVKDSGKIIKKLTKGSHKIGKRKTRSEEIQGEDKNRNTDDSLNVKSIGRRKRIRIELNDADEEKRMTRSMKTMDVAISKTDKLENKSNKRKYENLVKIEPASAMEDIEERIKSYIEEVSSLRSSKEVKEPALKRSRLQGSNSLEESFSLKLLKELKELPAIRSNSIKKENASDFHSKTSTPSTSKEDQSFKYENGPDTSWLNGLSSSHEEEEGKWVPPGSITTPPPCHSAWLGAVLRKSNAQQVAPNGIEREPNAQSSSINSVALLMHNWSCNNQKSGSSAWASSFLRDLKTWDRELIPLLTTTSLMENHKSLELMESAANSLLKYLGPKSNSP